MTSKLGLRNAQTIYQQNALNNLQQQLIGFKDCKHCSRSRQTKLRLKLGL